MAYVKPEFKKITSSIYDEDQSGQLGPLEKTSAGGIIGGGDLGQQQKVTESQGMGPTEKQFNVGETYLTNKGGKTNFTDSIGNELTGYRKDLFKAGGDFLSGIPDKFPGISQALIDSVAGGNKNAIDQAGKIINPTIDIGTYVPPNVKSQTLENTGDMSKFLTDQSMVGMDSAKNQWTDDKGLTHTRTDQMLNPGQANFEKTILESNPLYQKIMGELRKTQAGLTLDATQGAKDVQATGEQQATSYAKNQSEAGKSMLQEALDKITSDNMNEFTKWKEETKGSPNLGAIVGGIDPSLTQFLPEVDQGSYITNPSAAGPESFYDPGEISKYGNIANVLKVGGITAGSKPTSQSVNTEKLVADLKAIQEKRRFDEQLKKMSKKTGGYAPKPVQVSPFPPMVTFTGDPPKPTGADILNIPAEGVDPSGFISGQATPFSDVQLPYADQIANDRLAFNWDTGPENIQTRNAPQPEPQPQPFPGYVDPNAESLARFDEWLEKSIPKTR